MRDFNLDLRPDSYYWRALGLYQGFLEALWVLPNLKTKLETFDPASLHEFRAMHGTSWALALGWKIAAAEGLGFEEFGILKLVAFRVMILLS